MQIAGIDNVFRLGFEIVVAGAALASSYITMTIKANLAEMRESQLRHQMRNQEQVAQMRAELIQFNNKVAGDLQVHAMEDRGEFREIRGSLHRLEETNKKRPV